MSLRILKKFILLLIVFFVCTVYTCKAQYKYKYPPENKIILTTFKVNIQDFKDIKSYLPKQYKTDGSVDYTQCLQKAIDENDKILIPNFPILINDQGLNLHDNSKIYFQNKSCIILSPSNRTNYGIINVEGVNNVSIYNPKLIGDRFEHLGNSGEWGMGINIMNSSNIQVYNSNITNCWGDGIYLGSIEGKTINNNISIIGGVVDNNRRNGISIISASNVLVKDILLSNSNGTLPMAGIDLEPNNNSEELQNVNLENITTYNNGDTGFLIYLGSLLGNQKHIVSINIVNSYDYLSRVSISIPGLRNDYHKSIKKIMGEINIVNFTANDNQVDFARSSGNYVFTPKINLVDFKIISKKGRDKIRENELNYWIQRRRGILIDQN